ncbi:MAG TPA: superoxide dismutase family protein [Herpetosiphonaceae bacterium]
MRTLVGFLLMTILAAVSSANVAAQTGELRASAELKDASGQAVGTITLVQEGDTVHLLGSVQRLPPGTHGIHIHAVGACTPDFNAAGGHYNPTSKKHGLENPEGAHAGDMPNLQVNADGTGSYDHKNSMVTLREGPATLYDADGSSIVIHAGADDYKTDPSGNSGARIACAVIPAAQRDTPAASPTARPPQPTPAPGGGRPAQLPDTGSEWPLLPLLLLSGLGMIGGLLVTRRVRRQS